VIGMTDLIKQFETQGYVLDPETGRYAVEPSLLESLLRLRDEQDGPTIDFSSPVGAGVLVAGMPSETETPSGEPFDSYVMRQLQKLSAIVNDELLGRLGNRVARLEEWKTEAFGLLVDRIVKMERDVIEAAQAIDTVSEELDGTDKAVDRLNGRLNSFACTIDEMGDRIKTGERQTTFETSEDDARLKDVTRRLTGLEDSVAKLFSRTHSLSSQLGGVTSSLVGYGVPAAAEADTTAEYFKTGLKTQTTICDEHKAEYFKSGYEKGKLEADELLMKAACHRLRVWMSSAFTQATVDAAVRVVRGEVIRDAREVITGEG
jgi:hypothetical protein